MGVEYIHYVIPKNNAFKPNANQIANLIESLCLHKWLLAPQNAEDNSCFLQTNNGKSPIPFPVALSWIEKELTGDNILCWPVQDYDAVSSDLKYPFKTCPESPYYEFKLLLSNNYIYRISELINPFPNTKCSCGRELEFYPDPDIFYGAQISVNCPGCNQFFDVSKLQSIVRNGWTEEEQQITGGATSCFAIAIDCGKSLGEEEGLLAMNLHPDLKSLVEKTLDMPFYEIGDMN